MCKYNTLIESYTDIIPKLSYSHVTTFSNGFVEEVSYLAIVTAQDKVL